MTRAPTEAEVEAAAIAIARADDQSYAGGPAENAANGFDHPEISDWSVYLARAALTAALAADPGSVVSHEEPSMKHNGPYVTQTSDNAAADPEPADQPQPEAVRALVEEAREKASHTQLRYVCPDCGIDYQEGRDRDGNCAYGDNHVFDFNEPILGCIVDSDLITRLADTVEVLARGGKAE